MKGAAKRGRNDPAAKRGLDAALRSHAPACPAPHASLDVAAEPIAAYGEYAAATSGNKVSAMRSTKATSTFGRSVLDAAVTRGATRGAPAEAFDASLIRFEDYEL